MAIGLCVALLPTRSLRAQESGETAAVAFQRGSAAYERGDYADAAKAFERAYALRPHAAALFNEARALERLGDAPGAADAYEQALARDELRPQDKADCQARLSALARTLGSVLITGPAETRGNIGSLQQAPLPIRAHLATGRYELSLVRKDGQRATVLVGVTAGRQTQLRIGEHGAPWSDARTPAAMADHPTTWKVPTSAYVTGAAALAVTGLGAYLGVAGLQARDEFDASQRRDQGARDRAVRLRASANVAFGVAFAAAAATGILVYRAWRAPLRVSLLPTLRAPGAPSLDLSVSGRF